MRISRAGWALFAAAGLAGTAAAQGGQNITPAQAIAFLDVDADGKVSLQEYLRFQLPKLERFDANADGVLELKEFRESLEGEGRKNAERSFRAFNTEENRKGLTQREFLGYHAYVFNTFVDVDKDGFMSAEEWAKLMGR